MGYRPVLLGKIYRRLGTSSMEPNSPFSPARKRTGSLIHFDGTVHNTAPMLLFTPAGDYVFRTKVKVGFITKWDAGALMVWAGDHNWAKLSFELSPAKQPTMVTVVRGGFMG